MQYHKSCLGEKFNIKAMILRFLISMILGYSWGGKGKQTDPLVNEEQWKTVESK